MLKWWSILTGGSVRAVRETVKRGRLYGWRAAWTCVCAHGINFHIRVRNSMPGQSRVKCPCCGWQGYAYKAFDGGQHIFRQIECPQCGAHDRHRVLHLFLTLRLPSFTQKDRCLLLHFAPEKHTQGLLDSHPSISTVATDLQSGALVSFSGPRFASDIREMGVGDNTFDAVFCIHVLEHVQEDRQALAEIRRVLKPGGVAVIMVPGHLGPETHEWGYPDPMFCYHVRDYSTHDFARRLEGFLVETVTPDDLVGVAGRATIQVPDGAVIFCCTKGS
jgi:SAM-dependent methyltransferase